MIYSEVKSLIIVESDGMLILTTVNAMKLTNYLSKLTSVGLSDVKCVKVCGGIWRGPNNVGDMGLLGYPQ